MAQACSFRLLEMELVSPVILWNKLYVSKTIVAVTFISIDIIFIIFLRSHGPMTSDDG